MLSVRVSICQHPVMSLLRSPVPRPHQWPPTHALHTHSMCVCVCVCVCGDFVLSTLQLFYWCCKFLVIELNFYTVAFVFVLCWLRRKRRQHGAAKERGAYSVRRDRETQVHWLLEVFSVLELLQCSLGWGWCSTMRIDGTSWRLEWGMELLQKG